MSIPINDMLMTTCIEQRRDNICMMQLDFSSLCASVCENLRLIREKSIALSWQLEEHVVVMRNRELLQHLLANLITSTYRYGKEHGHIQVDLKQEHAGVLLSVTGDGRGVAKDQFAYMRQRFYQADVSHSNQGSGLELAMIQEITQLYHSYMKVEDIQGEGSYFTFCVPME